jgi:hypothetical protein
MLKSLIRILPFLIVTLLSIGGVELFYGVAEYYLLVPENESITGEASAGIEKKAFNKLEKHKNYDVIVERNLFQSYAKEPEPVVEKNDNPLAGLENTTLDLVLMGTITGRANKSRAIILEKAKRKQEIYYTGDVIQGAEIKEILRGKVILSFQGKDEVLDMSEASKVKQPASSAPAAVSPAFPRQKVVERPTPRPSRRVVPRNVRTRNLPEAGEMPDQLQEETDVVEEPAVLEEVEDEAEEIESAEGVEGGAEPVETEEAVNEEGQENAANEEIESVQN